LLLKNSSFSKEKVLTVWAVFFYYNKQQYNVEKLDLFMEKVENGNNNDTLEINKKYTWREVIKI
jgi:hypothetical protein